ncbi:MAG: type 1 glutamine amidotransferase [Acidimicrobiales bacterium]|nr:type 1 glutamine amidotransferase [Acidimicrobiales bacterium]
MTGELTGKTVAFITANEGVEQAELTGPWEAVKEAGATPVLVAPSAGKVQAFDHLDPADTFAVDKVTGAVSVDEFDALVLPGGVANADQLRTDAAAVNLVREFFRSGRPVAAICHAPWTIIEAAQAQGRTMTSWPSLQTDIRNAGGRWVDEEVTVCAAGPNVLVTSRKPDDLPVFNREAITAFGGGRK